MNAMRCISRQYGFLRVSLKYSDSTTSSHRSDRPRIATRARDEQPEKWNMKTAQNKYCRPWDDSLRDNGAKRLVRLDRSLFRSLTQALAAQIIGSSGRQPSDQEQGSGISGSLISSYTSAAP
jgi:hypothetical protein